ncbi:MAG TPA: redoxin family protein [Pyrinomonadaceae bacterium]|jgi:tetratricopeptide (TPR) repeat protein|nr:redoxin family protein [Pyrinomonadaceae bacterium]
MKTHLILILSACLAAALFTSGGQAQTAVSSGGKNSPTDSKAGVKKLRDLFFARDFSAGYETGQKLLSQFPEDDELRMWVVLNGARSTDNYKAALAMAGEMAARNSRKDSGVWALIALAMANSYNGNAADALKTAETVVKLAPGNEEAIFCYNTVIFRAGKYAESIEWLDKNADKIKDRSRFYYNRALSNYQANNKEKAFKDFDTSIKLDPGSVNAFYLYSYYLNLDKRTKEALPLLKKALQLAPNALANRVAYWRMLADQTEKTGEQKEQEIVDDINALLKTKPNSPQILFNVSLQYGTLQNTQKQEFYEAQILKKFPNTKFAELIIVQQIFKMNRAVNERVPAAGFMKKLSELDEARLLGDRELLDESLKYINPDKKEADRIDDEWRAFIRRPRHFDMDQLGMAYFWLFLRAKYDFQMPDQKLKELLDAVRKYKNDRNSNTNKEIADLLAVRKVFGLKSGLTGEMLSYAKAGIEEGEADAADFRAVLNAKDAEGQAKYIRSNALETLGFALYLENKFDEAEKELLKAYEINNENADVLLILALVHRARKEFDKAEDIYLRSATITNTLTASIKELYKAKNGDLRGFDAYYKNIKEKVRARIMIEVAASRIKEPKDLAPFALKTIEQGSIASDDVKGKVVVINFWGVWCGPCVKEMPEIQELATKYKNDSDVAILTFDSRDDLMTVKKFIADRKYDFPVLMADSYAENLRKINDGGETYPTTLFVDKKGKISFLKVGNTGNLVEEFSLRIDILKQDK